MQPIVGTLDNLFDDLDSSTVAAGYVDYRCFYIFNDNADAALYDAKIFILSESAGVTMNLGFHTQNDIQLFTFSSLPTSGSVIFSYENQPLYVTWGGTLAGLANDLATALNGISGPGIVQYVILGDLQFSLTFLGGKFQTLLTTSQNTLGVNITVTKQKNGSPINAITVQVDSVTTPPSGILWGFPTSAEPVIIGDLLPGDGFPVWCSRTVTPGKTAPILEGFTVRLNGSPAAPIIQHSLSLGNQD